MERMKIAVVMGSTRPGRLADAVAGWLMEQLTRREDAEYEIVDLADHALPLLDEPMPAIMGEYRNPHTRAWSERVAGFDAFVFVTPEYNRSIPAALKNALDYLYAEWGDKAAGIVSYGADAGGARAAEHLRQILGELRVADVRSTVAFNKYVDFDAEHRFAPAPYRSDELHLMLDQLVSWAAALRATRAVAR
ncbi:NADPH-dependent FMN reductase [Pseudonocardia acaciae]|uniref:NADPH-dependent FMN reductase n=1 Tax=Pseudonocardia acaciae TaxID=551276 RepID=UPI00048B0F92|nr:NAD(P)H-dependent oxidoreductase [Pseudonocardia acaciae]